jgi:hypothetical protein
LLKFLTAEDPAGAQAGDERDRLVMAVRYGGAHPATAPTAPAFARHVRGSPGLVDEHQLSRVEIELPGKPNLSLLQNVRALLLLGVRGLFLKVIP